LKVAYIKEAGKDCRDLNLIHGESGNFVLAVQ